MLRCESCQSFFLFKWFSPQFGGLQEVEERVGDLEAEHDYLMEQEHKQDYLIEQEVSLHSTLSNQQAGAF